MSTATAIEQLTLSWEPEPTIKPQHLEEWITGSAISPGIAEAALESISGEQQVLQFLKPKAINGHRCYGGAMPMAKWAREARRRFADPCRGGWLAHGHAPLEAGTLVPVTFKPDKPRLDGDGDLIKYERPSGRQPQPYFPPLDEAAIAAICRRAGLTPPLLLSSWEAWLWLLQQPQVTLHLDEGEKKAAAACSAGFLTIGVAGIWGGCPRPRDASGKGFGSHTLLAELSWLSTIRPAGAPLVIAFDASEKPNGKVQIRKARRTLGRLLEKEGHAVAIRDLQQPATAKHFIKGTDDLIAHGGAAAVAALPVVSLKEWLVASSLSAVAAHLLQPYRFNGRRRRLIDRHFRASDLPASASLLACIGPMGSNKTGALSDLAAQGAAMSSITHRRSLADQQGSRLRLMVKREGELLAPQPSQHPLQQTALAAGQQTALASKRLEEALAEHEGFITVLDSSHPGGSGELLPEHCAGKILVIDEADAVLRHALTSQTAIAAVRCEVLANLGRCVLAAQQVILLGAHIDELTLEVFEAMRGVKAQIIESTLQPANGRDLTLLRKEAQLLQQLRNRATHRQPFILHTSAMEASSRFSPINLAKQVRKYWPEARILELTSKTIREKHHPAAAAIRDPLLFLHYDVVIASPVLETGFSIEDPHQHFTAVLAHTSGHTTPTAFVQSIGRLRSNVPRFLFATASGTCIGNGSTWANEVQATKAEHAVALYRAGAALADPTLDSAAFFSWWAKLAAEHNWLVRHYREACAALLKREGYNVHRLDQQHAPPDPTDRQLLEELVEIRDESKRHEDTSTAACPSVSDEQLEALEAKRRHTSEERLTIRKARIQRGFGIQAPTPEQVSATRDGAHGKLLRSVLLRDPAARRRHREKVIAELSPSQRAMATDFTEALSHFSRAELAANLPEVLQLLELVGTNATIVMADFETFHKQARQQRYRWREVFGFDPGDDASTTTTRTFIASVLKAFGLRLERTERRERRGEARYWHYRVVDDLKLIRTEAEAHIAQTLQSWGGSFLP